MVPSLRGPAGDEASLHLEHLPVHRVRWAARPGQGELGYGVELPSSSSTQLLGRPTPDIHKAMSIWFPWQLHDFFSYLMDHFTPNSHNESEYELCHVLLSQGRRTRVYRH